MDVGSSEENEPNSAQQRKQRLTDVERNRLVYLINIPWNIYKRYTKMLRNTIYIYIEL